MDFEFVILDWLQSIHSPLLDSIMIIITKLGNVGGVWIPLTLILLLCKKTRRIGQILVLGLIIEAVICNLILKPTIARIRPYEINQAVQLLISKPTDYSFPSGHTSAAFTTFIIFYLVKEKRLWIPTLILGLLVAFSRMYLYVHYPTDILGGIILGILAGYIAFIIMNKVEKNNINDLS